MSQKNYISEEVYIPCYLCVALITNIEIYVFFAFRKLVLKNILTGFENKVKDTYDLYDHEHDMFVFSCKVHD